jgi:hypothetical protein
MSILKNIVKASIAAALVASSAAHAGPMVGGTVNNAMGTVLEGNSNERGYAVIDINVGSSAVVDFLFTDGYGDATFSLFSVAGKHLVTNDDANYSLNPRLTQRLATGNYYFMVSYCCTVFQSLENALRLGTDGYNQGSYAFRGNASLHGVTTYLDNSSSWGAANAAYRLTMTNANNGHRDVPEPQTVALFGAALAGMAMARRHKNKA